MENRVKSVMAEILDIDEDSIGPEFSPEDTDNWDSLNNLRMITALESEFDIALTMNEIENMIDFEAIVMAIESRLK